MSVRATAEGTWLVQPGSITPTKFLGTWPEVYADFRESVRYVCRKARDESRPGHSPWGELSSRYSGDYVTAVIDSDTEYGYHESIGSTDELGYYGRVDGPIDPNVVLSFMIVERWNLSAEQYRELTTMAGAIVYMNDQGFVSATTYPTTEKLHAAWDDVERHYAEHWDAESFEAGMEDATDE